MERIKQHPKLLSAITNLAFAMIVFSLFGMIMAPRSEALGGVNLLTSGYAYDYAIGIVGLALNAVAVAARDGDRITIGLDLGLAFLYTVCLVVVLL